ncbi:MAG TPA: transketolase [Allosphingosinicella sp.]|nr:transketolase [Allosphingosinicella sp.]
MAVEPNMLANAIRALAMDAVQAANSGHPGMPMGMADAATVLWTEYLRHDPSDPHWPDRDRFVLSAGHGSMLIYALLHLTGYARPTMEDIANFRQLNSPCAGHPENFLLDAVEATTGPLGQGFAMAVGMAIAERRLNSDFGDDLVDHRTWVIAGDGCLMEGINHEAAGLAGHLALGRLNVLWDDNRITIDGSTDLSTSEDIEARYRAYGWHTVRCDGHDADDVRRALDEALADDRPSLIACRTIIGFGAPNKQGTAATHGAALGADEVAAARKTLAWESRPFELPAEILDTWRQAGRRSEGAHRDWRSRVAASEDGVELLRRMSGALPSGFSLQEHVSDLIANPQEVATRKASEMALGSINALLPETIGGSADLTGSNNTRSKNQKPFTGTDHSGTYIYYGIREFGMAAAMNGMALHGGVIPYGGTFLVFADYCRPAIRLSALQQARVIYVMTHDSIGLGEDGPTHQPIEHLMSLRSIPNLDVLRPADAVETAECWELALRHASGPSLIALTRQNLPQLRTTAESGNLCARGAYRLHQAATNRQVVILATGSEVHVALEVAAMLESHGIGVDVVSMPSWARFDAQDSDYREGLLPDVCLLVSIEAGSTMGWERYVGRRGLRIGIDRFGASAPAEDLFKRFGFTADAIVPRILAALKS